MAITQGPKYLSVLRKDSLWKKTTPQVSLWITEGNILKYAEPHLSWKESVPFCMGIFVESQYFG